MAEDFAFEQLFGQAAAIDGDEVARMALAGLVQAARHQFLAGAGLAVDQHVGVGAGEVGDQPAQALDRGRMADQAGFEFFASGQAFAQF
ncbi:hypothetical protein D9M69_520390 [compost metagenome]